VETRKFEARKRRTRRRFFCAYNLPSMAGVQGSRKAGRFLGFRFSTPVRPSPLPVEMATVAVPSTSEEHAMNTRNDTHQGALSIFTRTFGDQVALTISITVDMGATAQNLHVVLPTMNATTARTLADALRPAADAISAGKGAQA
jgi:hypothetical protein